MPVSPQCLTTDRTEYACSNRCQLNMEISVLCILYLVCIKCKHCLVRWVMDESKDEYHVTWTNIELAWPCRVQRRIPARLRSSQVNVLPVGVNENSACECEKWPLKFVLTFKGGCSIIYVVGSFHGGVIRIKFPYIHNRLE